MHLCALKRRGARGERRHAVAPAAGEETSLSEAATSSPGEPTSLVSSLDPDGRRFPKPTRRGSHASLSANHSRERSREAAA
ncbi:hypothetical protein EYF80_066587 [Liparis tanakae]|uniref:Uncharacterized protein n=1 Tax=Liparis tanakae TaxID=230148 RepID=A0A4Z2E3S6_9TELE|nr:hypothetical protein EYF80_066587 [Liparis tanakae]